MSTREISIYDESYQAAVDLSASQYRAVKFGSVENTVSLAAVGAGIGVIQNKPEAGQAVQVRHLGISRVVVDGNAQNISINDLITSDAAGKGVVAAIGQLAFGLAMQDSIVDGDVISVLMIGQIRRHS